MIRTICRALRIPYRPPHSPDGPVILYTRAQVSARKALWARMGAVAVVCTVAAGGFTAARHAPASWLGIPPTVEAAHPVPVWRGMSPGLPVQRVPEPPTWPLLAIGIVGLVAVRNWRRHGRMDWFVKPADPERGYQQAALSLHDVVGREP